MAGHQDPWKRRGSVTGIFTSGANDAEPAESPSANAADLSSPVETAKAAFEPVAATLPIPTDGSGLVLDRQALVRHAQDELPRFYETPRLKALNNIWEVLQMYKIGALKFDVQADCGRGVNSRTREESWQHFERILDGIRALTAGVSLQELAGGAGEADIAAALRLPPASDEYRQVAREALAIVRLNGFAESNPRTKDIARDLEGLLLQFIETGTMEKPDQSVSRMYNERKPPPPKPYVPRPDADE